MAKMSGLNIRDAISLPRYFQRILQDPRYETGLGLDVSMMVAVVRVFHLLAVYCLNGGSILFRVSLGDLVHLLQLPPLFNLLFFLSSMWCLYIWPLFYWQRDPLSMRYLRLTYDLVIKRHLFHWYFVRPRFRSYQIQQMLATIHRLSGYCVLAGLILAFYLMAYVQWETYHRLWQLRQHLNTWHGWLAVLGVNLVLLLNFRAVLVVINCVYLTFLLSIFCSVTNYIEFWQCDQLLKRYLQLAQPSLQPTPYLAGRFVHRHFLWRFLRYHSRYMRLVAQVNGMYGRVLSAVLLSNGPSSAVLLVYSLVWDRHIDLQQWLVVAGISSTQFLFIFGMHLIAIRYSYFVHGCSRLLLSLSARTRAQQNADGTATRRLLLLVDRLKLHGYIERVHTGNRYGITYGSVTLVTFPTFFKFILFYFKLIVISARLLKQYTAETSSTAALGH